ncbi:hypothetical protein ACFOG5_08910 [Pedobacter fastidiosus]|nr:hypothetical protein [Pedobacter fastidiosus]
MSQFIIFDAKITVPIDKALKINDGGTSSVENITAQDIKKIKDL